MYVQAMYVQAKVERKSSETAEQRPPTQPEYIYILDQDKAERAESNFILFYFRVRRMRSGRI